MSIELDQIREAISPSLFAERVGFTPEPYQARVLDARVHQAILCCHRGAGKTEIVSLRAAHHIFTTDKALVLVASETAEKAGELIDRAAAHLTRAGFPAARTDRRRKSGYTYPNGARLLPLPKRAAAVRGYPATMVIIDEAAFVPDAVYTALRGTRAVTSTQASFWILSTPGARHGFFHDLWHSTDPAWTRIHLSAVDCPRIAPAFLDEERRQMHPADFAREYLAQFGETRHSLFLESDLQRAIRPHVPILGEPARFRPVGMPVLFNDGTTLPPIGFFFALDLGQSRDHSTLAVLEYQLVPTGRRCPTYCTWRHTVSFRLRWLEEFPRGTPYSDLAPILTRFLQHPEVEGHAQIVVDATGVGRAFFDQLRADLRKVSIQGVQITSGTQTSHSGSLWNIPKAELVLTLESMLRQGELEIAAGCPHLDTLLTQLRAFERIRLPGGRYTYTGKNHGCDDLVMALALAAGYAYQRYGASFVRKTA